MGLLVKLRQTLCFLFWFGSGFRFNWTSLCEAEPKPRVSFFFHSAFSIQPTLLPNVAPCWDKWTLADMLRCTGTTF